MELTRIIPHICIEWKLDNRELEVFHEIEKLKEEFET